MKLLAAILTFTLVCGSLTTAIAADKAEAQGIVDKAKGTLTGLLGDDNFYWLRGFIKDAKGIVIFPQVIKGGFFIGGSGGTGVMMIRESEYGAWSDPVFYTLGSVTFGLQIGGEAAEVVMLAMTQKAVDSLLNSSVKLGGDASIAVGPLGAGAKGSANIPEVRADFVSFSKSKGLYAGLNLEGSALAVRDALNEAYYGKPYGPGEIISKRGHASGAEALRAELGKVSRK